MTVYDSRVDAPDTETLLRRVIDILGNCRTLPLSSSVKLDNKDEVARAAGRGDRPPARRAAGRPAGC